MEKRRVLLDIAVPFSVKTHSYLTRETIPGRDSERMEKYALAVCTEIQVNAQEFSDCSLSAIRFGEGTASNLGAHSATIMRCIRDNFAVEDDVSISMQAAISNISGATMPFFKRAGVQRFDFEMMSLDSASFAKLNEVDSLKDFPIVCDYFLHSYDNDSLGIILAYGYSFPSERDVAASFRRSVISVARSHASHLILERAYGDGHAFEDNRALEDDYVLEDNQGFEDNQNLDSVAEEHLKQAREVLGDAGFVEYIPYHFSRSGKEDRYFLEDYKGAERLAFGLGACTRFDGALSKNTFDLDLYLACSGDYARITESVQSINAG